LSTSVRWGHRRLSARAFALFQREIDLLSFTPWFSQILSSLITSLIIVNVVRKCSSQRIPSMWVFRHRFLLPRCKDRLFWEVTLNLRLEAKVRWKPISSNGLNSISIHRRGSPEATTPPGEYDFPDGTLRGELASILFMRTIQRVQRRIERHKLGITRRHRQYHEHPDRLGSLFTTAMVGGDITVGPRSIKPSHTRRTPSLPNQVPPGEKSKESGQDENALDYEIPDVQALKLSIWSS
jgi:hypothetical protein